MAVDSFTSITGTFTQPSVSGNTASLTVGNSSWMVVGQIVFVTTGGYYTVASKADTTHVVLTNLGYTGNTAPASTGNGGTISPGGVQGATGATGATGAAGANGADGFTNSGSLGLSGGTTTLTAGTIGYFPIIAVAANVSTASGGNQDPVNVGGTLDPVVVTQSSAGGFGYTFTYTLYKNGSANGACTISGSSATTCTITPTSASYSSGDTIVMSIQRTSGSSSTRSATTSSAYSWGAPAIG